jgi:hypothetical protein
MYFKKTLLGLAIVGTLQGCDWGDKYQAIDCTANAVPGAVDCRTEGAQQPTSEGADGIDDGRGNMISFLRDDASLLNLSSAGNERWAASHEDQIDLFVTAGDNQVWVGSKFHNGLRALQSDSAGQVVTLGATAFLDVSGERYAVDAMSGASEQVFNGVTLKTGGDQTLIMARAEKYDSSSSSIGVGLYIESVDELFALPQREFASGNTANFIGYRSIRASTASPSGHAVAMTGRDRQVQVYAIGDYSGATNTVKLNIRGSSIAYSADETSLYVGGLALSGALVSLNSESLTTNWTVNLIDKPLVLLPVALGGVVAVLSSGASAYWLPENSDENTIVNIPLAQQATSAAINSRGTILVVADTDQGVEAISLTTGKRAYIKHSGAVQSLAIDGFGTLWVLSQGSLQGYLLPEGFK